MRKRIFTLLAALCLLLCLLPSAALAAETDGTVDQSRSYNVVLTHGLFHTGESVLVSGPGNFSCSAQSRIAAARAAWNASTYGRSFFIRSPRGSICAAP